jgi:hypothetical protein
MDSGASSSKTPVTQISTYNQNHNTIQTTLPVPRINIPRNDTNGYHQHQQQTPSPSLHNSQNDPDLHQRPRRSPGFFVYPEKVVNEGVAECKRSLLGKIITDKPIHVNSIQMGLENIWGTPQGLKIQELEGKILQFFMDKTIDQERILLGNPWIFRNSWLIVQTWDRKSDPALLDFDHAPVWVQMWGLPPHCKTKQMGQSIGELLGKVEKAEKYEYPGKKVIIKVKVAINVHQPVLTGILIGNANDGTHWIDFRYENLPLVCFNCGIVGHAENLCQNQPLDMENSAPLGAWIRSNQFGRRILDLKDKKHYSNPSKAANFGTYSPPIPASMLEQMAAMKLKDDLEAEASHNSSQQKKKGAQSTQTGATGLNTKPAKSLSLTEQQSCVMHSTVENGMGPQLLHTKRQRVEITSSNGMTGTMEDTYMAGPAEQAGQPS